MTNFKNYTWQCRSTFNLNLQFWLSAFAKLQKATISFFVSVCLSVDVEKLDSHWTDLREICYLSICRKSVDKFQVSLKSDRNKGYSTWRPTYISDSNSEFFLEWEMFQTKVVEKIKTHILFSITCFRILCCLWDNVKKCGKVIFYWL
jgi:hypothetical protein